MRVLFLFLFLSCFTGCSMLPGSGPKPEGKEGGLSEEPEPWDKPEPIMPGPGTIPEESSPEPAAYNQGAGTKGQPSRVGTARLDQIPGETGGKAGLASTAALSDVAKIMRNLRSKVEDKPQRWEEVSSVEFQKVEDETRLLSLTQLLQQMASYEGRSTSDLTKREQLKLKELKKKAILLLLLTNVESEEGRKVLGFLEKFPLTEGALGDAELAGLQFVLYQRYPQNLTGAKRGEALEYLMRELNKRKAFELRNVQFCEKVAGYEQVVPKSDTTFPPGERIWIYGEFAGCKSKLASDGKKEQRIKVYLAVVNEAGKVVDTTLFVSAADGTMRFAADKWPEPKGYFSGAYVISRTLQSGNYTLRLTAEDLIGGSEVKKELDFQVR